MPQPLLVLVTKTTHLTCWKSSNLLKEQVECFTSPRCSFFSDRLLRTRLTIRTAATATIITIKVQQRFRPKANTAEKFQASARNIVAFNQRR